MENQELSGTQGIDASDEASGSHSKPILVRRMFQVLCISIHRDLRFESSRSYPTTFKLRTVYDGKPCHIYGLVRVFSEDGRTLIDIYKRDKHECEVVEFGGFLSITNSHVISPAYLRLAVYLYDMAHNAEVANGIFDLDYRDEPYKYDELQEKTVKGKHGFASIHHSTVQHAVVADVGRVVLNKLAEAESGSDVSGTVTARLDNDSEVLPSGSHPLELEEFPPSILFKGGARPFESGVSLQLLKTSIVVPSFCPLVIAFRDDADRKIVEDMSLDVADGGGGLIRMSSKGQGYESVFEGEWRQGYASEPTQLVLSHKQQPCSSNIFSAMPRAFPCVEIFSVLVCGDDGYVKISGTVIITDSSGRPFRMFDGEESCSSGTALPIVGPTRSYDIHPFTIQIQIRDVHTNQLVSNGSFMWNFDDDAEGGGPMSSYYNKLLCSVIRGDAGYAAVHYSMITHGIQAKLRVLIRKQGYRDFSIEVSGDITARYDGYTYPTLYDRNYYRNRVFNVDQTRPLRFDLIKDEWIQLPLAKPVISLPLDDLLVLDVDLMVVSPVFGDDGGVIESRTVSVPLKECLKFGPEIASRDIFFRQKYTILVNVDFSHHR